MCSTAVFMILYVLRVSFCFLFEMVEEYEWCWLNYWNKKRFCVGTWILDSSLILEGKCKGSPDTISERPLDSFIDYEGPRLLVTCQLLYCKWCSRSLIGHCIMEKKAQDLDMAQWVVLLYILTNVALLYTCN